LVDIGGGALARLSIIVLWAQRRVVRVQAHHVEGNDVLEGDFAILVPLDKTLVDKFWAASSWEAKDEGLGGSGIERLDTFCTFT
jgi:hypothetical protein